MGFTFLHTADWQIGKPFRNFPGNVAGRLEEARLGAIDRLAERAVEAGASHVLVAGDIYDASNLPAKTRRQPMERMKRHSGLTWLLLPGNHDPARAGGIWQFVAADGVPDNIVVLTESMPFELAPGIALLPAPLTAKALSGDPTSWMDEQATPEGSIRIGLAHGSVRGFGSSDESSVNIDPGRAASAGLSYLALGDWHGQEKVNARTWYSGTPEPDRFRENAPGQALVVRVREGAGGEGSAAPEVTPVEVSQFTWAQVNSTIVDKDKLASLDRQISGFASDPARVLLRLSLDGLVDAPQLLEIDRWIDEWDARLQYLEVDRSKLRASIDPSEVSAIRDSTELSEAARRLSELASGDDPDKAVTASLALRHLVVLANTAEREDTP